MGRGVGLGLFQHLGRLGAEALNPGGGESVELPHEIGVALGEHGLQDAQHGALFLPVLLCGLICGWQYGLVIGLCLPLVRSMIFGMPPIFPTGIAMTFELAAYGLIVGLVYQAARQKNTLSVYRALIIAMIGGRIIWGIVRVLLTGVGSQAFTWHLFLEGALLTAIPGIILQLILIPVLMAALTRSGLLPLEKAQAVKG